MSAAAEPRRDRSRWRASDGPDGAFITGSNLFMDGGAGELAPHWIDSGTGATTGAPAPGLVTPLALPPVFQGEIAVDERRRHGALSHSGCDALDGTMPKVSDDEHAWLA